METLRYSYKTSLFTAVLMATVFAGIAAFAFHSALNDDRQMALYGLVPLGVDVMHAIYWTIGALMLATVVGIVVGRVRSGDRVSYVTLDRDALTLEGPMFGREPRTIPLSTIDRVEIQFIRAKYLAVHYSGKSVTIFPQFFRGNDGVDRFAEELDRRRRGDAAR